MSGDYNGARTVATFAWALAAALGCLLWDPEIAPVWLLLGQLPVAAVVWAGLGLPALQRLLGVIHWCACKLACKD